MNNNQKKLADVLCEMENNFAMHNRAPQQQKQSPDPMLEQRQNAEQPQTQNSTEQKQMPQSPQISNLLNMLGGQNGGASALNNMDLSKLMPQNNQNPMMNQLMNILPNMMNNKTSTQNAKPSQNISSFIKAEDLDI